MVFIETKTLESTSFFIFYVIANTIAQREFGIAKLKAFQIEALRSLVGYHRDTVVRVPTGGGKSLIFWVCISDHNKLHAILQIGLVSHNISSTMSIVICNSHRSACATVQAAAALRCRQLRPQHLLEGFTRVFSP